MLIRRVRCLFDEFALVGAPLVEAEDHAGTAGVAAAPRRLALTFVDLATCWALREADVWSAYTSF
eukprot:2236404-Pleurochrysis_carterae.AAC.2